MTEIPEHAISNDLGHVALKFYRLFPYEITTNGSMYRFQIQANIPLAWVKPEDVDTLINARTRKCCGGTKKKGGILFASEADVRQWTNRGGR